MIDLWNLFGNSHYITTFVLCKYNQQNFMGLLSGGRKKPPSEREVARDSVTEGAYATYKFW